MGWSKSYTFQFVTHLAMTEFEIVDLKPKKQYGVSQRGIVYGS